MKLLRVLWSLYRGPSKGPRHQPPLAVAVTRGVHYLSKLELEL